MKKLSVFLFFSLISFVGVSQTATKSTAVGSVSIDGCGTYCTNTGLSSVSFSASDFGSGCIVTDVDVSITWAKTAGTCSNPTTGASFHGETSFRIDGPTGNTEALIPPGYYGGNATMSAVTTVFNQGSGQPTVAGGTPNGGTFSPASSGGGNLNDFNGSSAFGTWNLRAGDTGGGDPLCVNQYSVTVVTQADNTPPSFTSGPSNIVVNTSNTTGGCAALVTWSPPVASDVCGGVIVNRISGQASGTSFPVGGPYTITYTATDRYGNTTSGNGNYSFTVTVVDDENPVISNCPVSFTAASPCGANVTWVAPTATDNCSVSSFSQTGPASASTFPPGTTAITYTALDAAGNQATCAFNVTVTDAASPVISCPPGPITATTASNACTVTLPYSITATDNCSSLGLTFTGSSSPNVVTPTANGGNTNFPVGNYTLSFTVADAAGNTDQCSFAVQVTDNIVPTISCPSVTTLFANANCEATANWQIATAADACGIDQIIRTGANTQLNSGDDFPLGTKVISYRAFDNNGNFADCSFNVTVVDNTNPQITCPSNIQVNNDAGFCGARVTYTPPVGTDNCPSTTSLTSGSNTESGDFFAIGATTVSYEAEDGSNNATSCSFTIEVLDAEFPTVANCPTGTVFQSTASGTCSAIVNINDPQANDNCPGSVLTLNSALGDGSLFQIGSTQVDYSVEDASGNVTSCLFTVTVEDNEFPFISCPANQSVTFPNCQYTIPNYLTLGAIDTSDNCTPVLVMAQNPPAGTVVSSLTTVQVSATDDASNLSTCAFTITPLDNVPPTIGGCPAPGEKDSVDVNSSCQFLIPNYALVLTPADDCNPSPTVTQSPPAGTTSATAVAVTVSVSDGSNTTTCTFDAVPKDATAPTITCPADRTEPANASCMFTLPDYTTRPAVTAVDNCGGTPVRSQPSIGNVINGTTTVFLYATDAAGNVGSCSFEVSLQDNIIPTISCPASYNVYTNANCLYSVQQLTSLATTGDNCAGPVTVTQNPLAGSSVSGTPTLELTAKDVAGNTATCNIALNLLDTIAPNIGCPQPQTVNVNGSCEYTMASFTSLATATDACSAVTKTQSPAAGAPNTFNFSVTPTVAVTIYATDASLNVDSCTFDVLLRDVTGPTITCGPNVTGVIFDQNCETQVGVRTGNYTGLTDNCGGTPTVTQSPISSTVIQGQTTVTLTATDASGNTGTCTFDVVPTDPQLPTIDCPQAPISVNADASCHYTLGDYTGLTTSSDNCDQSLAITQTPGFGTVITTGTQSSVSVRATDDAGNFSTCTITVIPVDNTPPSITCPPNQLENFNASCQFSLGNYVSLATATDNCNPAVTVTQLPAPSQIVTGTTQITLTANDGTNTASCTFNVIPNDNAPPTITCPYPFGLNVSFNSSCQYNILNYTGLATGVTDNCGSNPGDVVVTQSLTTGTAIGDTVTITLTATDPAGNTATCVFDVNPADNTNPNISCPQNQTVNVDGSCQYSIIDYKPQAVATDACDANLDITQSPVPQSGILMAVVTTVTLTATDDAGNFRNCTFTVTGVDNTPPTISCPTDTVVAGNANCQFVMLNETANHELVLADNCGGTPTVTQSPVAGSTILGSAVVTLTAQDASGNTANCTFSYTVNDQTNPTINCPANMSVSSNASCVYVVPDFSTAGSTDDNCDANPVVTQNPIINQVFVDDTLVTLTVTDASGNFATCTFTISESTNDLPNITCPGDQLVDLVAGCQFTLGDYTSLAVATDNCGTPTVSQTQTPGGIYTGLTTVELVATDAALNTVSCTFDVIPNDNDAPTVTCAQPTITVPTSGQCTFTVADYTGIGFVNATDNCPNTFAFTQSPVAGSLIGSATTITISTTDAAGNIGSCTMVVTPQDNAVPTLFCPANVTVSLDANCEFDLPDYTPLVFVSDNCDSGPFTVSQIPASGSTITGEDVTTVQFSVIDGNSNVGNCSITVTTEDNAAPTISCPANAIVSANSNCEFTLADYTLSATINDNCTNLQTLTVTQTPAANADYSGNQLVTIEATDDAGNSNSCTFSVTPEDDTKPSLTCPPNQTPNFTANCQFTLVDYRSLSAVSDFCDNQLFVSQSPGIGTIISGTTTVSITALDDAGNDSTCTFQIIPVDVQAPTVACPSNFTVNVDANCAYDIVDYRSMVTATDNCANPVGLTQNPSTGTLSGAGSSSLITMTATDNNTNTASCTFTITLVDDTDPVLANCPANQTVNLNANCQYTVANFKVAPLSATDACGGSVTLAQSPLSGSLIGGETDVTITATDVSGNTSVCTFTVTPADVSNPNILACPANISVNNNPTICGAVVSYPTVTAIDNCAGFISPTLNNGQLSGTVFPVGVTPVVYEAADGNGNSAFCNFTVTVNDTEDPVIVCPANVTENALVGTCEAVVSYHLPTVSDNCPGVDSTLLVGFYPDAIFPVGTTLVTFEANDVAGNTSTCSFNVIVLDAEPPMITCPADMTVSNDAGLCTAVVTYPQPTVTDNCTSPIVPTLTGGLASGGTFAFGPNTVFYQAEDVSGNTDNCSFTITVEDNELPVLTCPNDTSLNCDATVAYNLPMVTDNCNNSIVPLQTVPSIASPFAFGPTTVTFTGDDGNGNIGTCSFVVTVIDTVAPIVTCPSNQMEAFNALCQMAAVDYTSLGSSTDQCDGAPVITQSPAAGTTISGSAVITLIATDLAGNAGTCTFSVIDDTPPVISCPADELVGSDINCQFTLLDYTSLVTTSDNCGASGLSQFPAAGTIISTTTTITVTATDDFGNTSTCDFEVELYDNIDPSITCIGNQVGFFNGNCEYLLPNYTGQAFSNDNCDPNPIITQFPAVGQFVQGDTIITLTATDIDGNAISCSFSLSPIDNLPPTIVCPTPQTEFANSTCFITLSDYTALATVGDGCGASAVVVSQFPASGSLQSALNTFVTLSAVDGSGNQSSCVFQVTREDAIAPTIICPVNDTVDLDANCRSTLLDYTSLGIADDNCSTQFSFTQTPVTGTSITTETQVELTVNDGNGNASTCTFQVIPEDNLPPVITSCSNDLEISFGNNCQFQIGDYIGLGTATDNCSNVTVSQSPSAGTFVSSASVVTLYFSDVAENIDSCSFNVTPIDDELPSIICPANQEVDLTSACVYALLDYASVAVASDNCATNVSVTQNVSAGTLITGNTTITLTADDGNGNTNTCSFDVIPSDNTAPSLACPANQVVDFNENCEFEILDYKILVASSDNCNAISISQNPVETTVITAQTNVTMTSSDLSGNTVSCSFQVIPSDNELPEISCPSNQDVVLDENCQYQLINYTGQSTLNDNCTANLIVSQFPPVATVLVGLTEVTITVQDDAGNSAQCMFEVNPVDDTDPVATLCPSNQTVALNPNCQFVVPNYTGFMEATDNCDQQLEYVQQPIAGTVINGLNVVTVQVGAIDDNYNFAVCEFEVALTDAINPTVSCPADQQVQLSSGCQFVLPDYTTISSGSDACGAVTLTQSPVAGTAITSQLNTTIIAEDESGNTATCTFFVTPVPMVVTVQGTDATCNSGSNGSATVTVTGGTPPYTEDWGGFNPQALAAGNYAVIVTDANGCPATGSVVIADGPLFELEITPNGTVYVCEGESIQLSAGAGYAVYQWSTGASVPSINVSNEASYWVSVADANGCWSNADTAIVEFYQGGVPQINTTLNGLLECSNDSSQTYQWYLNGSPIPGGTAFTHCPTVSGNYVVAIVDANGCEVESGSYEITFNADAPCLVGINEYGLSLDVYPNPSTGLFTVKYALDHQMDVELAVFDLVGSRVSNDVLISALSGTAIINLSQEAEGVYLLRINLGNDKMLQQRLVLVK